MSQNTPTCSNSEQEMTAIIQLSVQYDQTENCQANKLQPTQLCQHISPHENTTKDSYKYRSTE